MQKARRVTFDTVLSFFRQPHAARTIAPLLNSCLYDPKTNRITDESICTEIYQWYQWMHQNANQLLLQTFKPLDWMRLEHSDIESVIGRVFEKITGMQITNQTLNLHSAIINARDVTKESYLNVPNPVVHPREYISRPAFKSKRLNNSSYHAMHSKKEAKHGIMIYSICVIAFVALFSGSIFNEFNKLIASSATMAAMFAYHRTLLFFTKYFAERLIFIAICIAPVIIWYRRRRA